MPERPSAEDEALIRNAYRAFNQRDINGALAAMTPDVDWPNGWEGGYVRGHDEMRACWTRQWSELDPSVVPGEMTVSADGRVIVRVEQQIRQPDGEVVHAGAVQHTYTMRDGLVARMDIVEVPPDHR